MKRLICAAIVSSAIASAALAKDVTVTLSDQDQQTWNGLLGAAFDQCVGAAILRSEASQCREVSNYIAAFASRVRASSLRAEPPPQAAPADPPPAPPTPQSEQGIEPKPLARPLHRELPPHLRADPPPDGDVQPVPGEEEHP